jgi:hypothetical protein
LCDGYRTMARLLFVDADDEVNDQVDAQYRAKYRRYAEPIVGSIVRPAARSATIKLVPRSTPD